LTESSIFLIFSSFLKIDIVPDPPDGPPVIEAITGKTISLSWKRPKRLDSSVGGFVAACFSDTSFVLWHLEYCSVSEKKKEIFRNTEGLNKTG